MPQGCSFKANTYANRDTATLPTLFRRQAVRIPQICTPVPSPNRQHAELGNDDGRTDSGSDFLRGLDSQSNMSLRIADDDNSLEASPLTGAGLLLDWLDLRPILMYQPILG